MVKMLEMHKTTNHFTLDLAVTSENELRELTCPEVVVDATGFKSNFMHELLSIPFKGCMNYGCAIKTTWPSHQFLCNNTEIEFHDCHPNTSKFINGYSSSATFSPIVNHYYNLLSDYGFSLDFTAKPTTYHETKGLHKWLHLLLKDLSALDKKSTAYKHSLQLFNRFRSSDVNGLSGLEVISSLSNIKTPGAKSMAQRIRQSVNTLYRSPESEPFLHLESERALDKVQVVFIPERIERYLALNKAEPTIDFRFFSHGEHKHTFSKKVNAFAVGDSLASTDFRTGQGLNRGLSVSTQIFSMKKDPETVRKDLINNCYSESKFIAFTHRDSNIQSARKWLLNSVTVV
ncbi:hypothetical protein [Spartinivicinus ruber]|uniref:hypothetical protein n=1 Tax=Spartinivicinus ruber TaxID=2683272 RepID=UPI0013D1F08E|nr:hypothetical protein [Spartinivicinus ruber]